jgi:hypothetical protein
MVQEIGDHFYSEKVAMLGEIGDLQETPEDKNATLSKRKNTTCHRRQTVNFALLGRCFE